MEEGFPRGGGISWQALLTAVLFLCLAFSYLTYYNGNPFLSQRINGLGALLACLVPALCLIWRGGILLLPPLKRWEIRQLALLHGSALMLWLISIGISIASVPFYLLYLRTGVHTTPMFVFYHVLNLCRLLTLALLVLSLLAAWQWSARFFTAAAHFQGAMTSLLCANETISCINPLGTRNYAMFMPPVVLYGMGLLSVAVVGLLVWREGRRFQRGRTV